MKTTILKLQGPCKRAHQSFTIVIQHIHKAMLLIASHQNSY